MTPEQEEMMAATLDALVKSGALNLSDVYGFQTGYEIAILASQIKIDNLVAYLRKIHIRESYINELLTGIPETPQQRRSGLVQPAGE